MLRNKKSNSRREVDMDNPDLMLCIWVAMADKTIPRQYQDLMHHVFLTKKACPTYKTICPPIASSSKT